MAFRISGLSPEPFRHLYGLSDAELASRRNAWTARPSFYTAGTLWKYAQTVGSAEKGAVTHPGGQAEAHVYAEI